MPALKIATFNINGIRSRIGALRHWLEREAPDVACLQELKTADEGFPARELREAGYGAIWHGQKSWNGVAILARGTEPTYLAAKANAAAAHERSKIAFAGLLPQVTATAGSNANRRDYDQRGQPPVIAIDNFNGNSAQIQLTQPLYRPSNLIAVRQAETAMTQSGFQVLAAEQELLSACLLAHTNSLSVSVAISVRAAALGPAGAFEQTEFPAHEGAFYGNLFLGLPLRGYACQGEQPARGVRIDVGQFQLVD